MFKKKRHIAVSMRFAFVQSIRQMTAFECDLNALGGFNFYTVLPPGYPHTGYLMHS